MTVNWRHCLAAVCLLAFVAAPADAQSRRRPPSKSYAPIGVPDQAEGARILDASRQIGFGASYYLEFELRVMPRRGAETRHPGRWLGLMSDHGPWTRIEVLPEKAQPEIWLVRGGSESEVWRSAEGGRFSRVDDTAAVIAESQVSAVDLQTPFLQWTAFTYEGMLRFRGRPTHVFLLYPPDHEADRYPGVGGVRAYVDTEYSALSQVEWVDPDGAALKTITAGSVRKVPGTDRWIVTTLDVRDEQTRDKTRLTIRSAALDLPLARSIFDPGAEAAPVNLDLPKGALKRFE